MRCPACGALNPEGADWCSQCYADLRPAPEPEPEAGPGPGPGPEPEPGPGSGPEPDRLRTGTADTDPTGGADAEAREFTTGAGRFRSVGEELEWSCAVCGEWNPLGSGACSVCGTAFGRTLSRDDRDELKDVDQGTVVLASGLLPGTGHILLGRTAQGATRATIFLFCLVGGYLLMRSAAASGQSVFPAVPLLLGAFLVWAGSIYDALALTSRQPELLTPRVLVWLVIGVVGLLLVSFIPGLLRVGQLEDEPAPAGVPTQDPRPAETVTVTAPPATPPPSAPVGGTPSAPTTPFPATPASTP